MKFDSNLYEETFVKKLKCPVHKTTLPKRKVSIHLEGGLIYSHLVNYCKQCDKYYFKYPEEDKVREGKNTMDLSKKLLDSKNKKYSIKDIEKISETENP